MELRQVRKLEDIRGMDRVNRRAWREAYARTIPSELLDRVDSEPEPRLLQRRFDEVMKWSGETYVADTGNIVGYAAWRFGDDTQSFVSRSDAGLKEIYVDPSHWGEGIGTQLLERVKSDLPEAAEGVSASMLAGNEVGRQFYETRGFTQVGEGTETVAGDDYGTIHYRLSLDTD